MKTVDAAALFLQDRHYQQLSHRTLESYDWALAKLQRAHPKRNAGFMPSTPVKHPLKMVV